MKYVILIYSIVFSFGLMAQSKTCFSSAKEAKDYMEGFWKIDGSSSGTFYKISLSNTIGKIETLEDLDFNPNRNSNKYDLVFNEDDRIVLEQEGTCLRIYLEINDLTGSILEEISFKTKNQFVLNNKMYTRYNIND